ncbi:MAG: hypothetical protein WD046_09450 [Paracoccaceae bacterium]
MGQAPKGQTSLSGQTGQGATPKQRKPVIRVLGERNTGTRAMAQMIKALPHIRENFSQPLDPKAQPILDLLERAAKIEQQEIGGNAKQSALSDAVSLAKPRVACWKHAMLGWDDSFASLSGALLSQRNPYSWVIALFARPYHHVGRRISALSTFIETPWLSIPRERMDLVVASPAALWNAKQAGAQRFAASAEIPTAFVSFEPFLADPVATLAAALEALGLDPAGLRPLAHSTKTNEPIDAVQARHAAEPWRNWLTSAQVSMINAHLDPAVMQAAGYEIENPDDFADTLSVEHSSALQTYQQLRLK